MSKPQTPVEAMLTEPDLIRVLSQRTVYRERKAALQRLLTKAWEAGWGACAEETEIALRGQLGVTPGAAADSEGKIRE